MAKLATQPALLTHDQARTLTAKIRDAVENVWDLLNQAHDGKAWSALSYPTWEEYVKQEFQMGRSQSYRILDYASIREALSPIGDKAATPTEGQARPLAQLDTPEQQQGAWSAAVEKTGGKPTAKDVQAAVDEIKPPPQPEPMPNSTPRHPAVADHEYDECLKRIGTVCGRALKDSIKDGALSSHVDRAGVMAWSKESDEKMLKLKELVGGQRRKVREAIAFLSHMPTSTDRINRLVLLALVEDDGKWSGTIDGVEFKLQAVAKKGMNR